MVKALAVKNQVTQSKDASLNPGVSFLHLQVFIKINPVTLISSTVSQNMARMWFNSDYFI